jgi:hypothetical protein
VSHPVQEEDRISSGRILAVGIISILIFGAGAVWSVAIQRSETAKVIDKETVLDGEEHIASAAKHPPEVGIVYQLPFNQSRYGDDKKDEKRAWLDSYGWVDKSAGITHIPVEKAIEQLAQAGGGK